MLAITLHQPWAWAVTHAGKRIENRTWRPPPSVVGQRIAIHAGMRLDRIGAEILSDVALSPIRVGSGVGLSSLGSGDGTETTWAVPAFPPQGAIVATATLADVVTESDSPWFRGPYGWVLADVVALAEPVPCKGRQRLWTVPEDIVANLGGGA